MVRFYALMKQYNAWPSFNPNSTLPEYRQTASQVNSTGPDIIFGGLLVSESYDGSVEGLTDLFNMYNASDVIKNGSNYPHVAFNALNWVYFTAAKTIFTIGGFDPPENSTEVDDTAFEEIDFAHFDVDEASKKLDKQGAVFELTYVSASTL